MKKLILLLIPIVFLSSCIIVKYEKQDKKAPQKIELSPKPRIEMSDQVIRSKFGDMIAFVPEDWFFVDVETRDDVFSTITNQDYSLSIVFDEIKKDNNINAMIKNKDYLGLAKYSLSEQKRRSSSKLDLVNDYQEVQIGEMKFITYYTTSTAGALLSRTAVFITEFGNCYRMSIIPMDIIGKPIPLVQQSDVIFESVLTTIKY